MEPDALQALMPDGMVPCTIVEISRSGARLQVDEGCALPEVFILDVKEFGSFTRRLVNLRWRHGHFAGVAFYDHDAEPLSAQRVLPLK